MEEALVGAVVGATIQVVLQNLILVSAKEIKLVRNFKRDLEKLKCSFTMIQNILYHADMQQVTDGAVKQWLKKLEDVAFEADNVLDEFSYGFLRNDQRTMQMQTTMKRKVKSIFSCSLFRDCHLNLGRKIRDINKELELINQEANSFGLQMRLASAHASSARSYALVGEETDSFTVDPIFLGRDNDVSRIVEILTTSPTEQVLSIVPIVGMGGLGKTTLVRKIYGDGKIMSHFGNRIWVHVSENFDPLVLFKSILTSLTMENVELGSREVVLKKLQDSLGDKRCLLVLDNVWNEEREKWDSFINSLAGVCAVRGNCIVVTTRSANVASIVKTLDINKLKGLSDDECWSIIKSKTFEEGDIPLGFETIGRNIAKRCQGLPLAANVVGGMLRGKSKYEWLSIEENWLSDFGGDGNAVSKILKLSFDNLSSPSLKKCFAYCSIFPRGYHINKEKLIELWMAEGFLYGDPRNDMETVGNKFFNILVQNSLLQVLEGDVYGNTTHCNMHDLVHDLACSVLGVNNLDVVSRVWNFGRKFIGDEYPPVPKGQARCLRLLFFNGEVSDILFSNFRCLHILVLTGDTVSELPSSIRELIHLRYLDISYTRIACLPDSIGELYHLQTFRALKDEEWGVIYLNKLPNTLKYLIKLRHLHIPNIELPPEIGRLTSLQTLPCFQLGDKKGRRIVELGSLKNLKGGLEIPNLEMVYDKEEAKSANLFQKPNIVKLTFRWSLRKEGEIHDENVLEGLQPHLNLKSLEIHGFQGRSFPLWTLKMAVQYDFGGQWTGLCNLMEIRLINCKECEEIPMLGHLPHLKSLYLIGLTNVRSIGSSFYGIDNLNSNGGVCRQTLIVFPSLERLAMSYMSNLTEWVEVELPSTSETQLGEVVVFPRLEYLNVSNCQKLMSVPSHFPCLKELKISEIDSGLPLANICGVTLTSLTKLTISRLDGLICLPDELFSNNQNLSELKVSDCHNLEHLVLCLRGGGASFRELHIVHCSNLRELPDNFHSLNSLEKLIIKWCPNLKSIPFPSGTISQGFTSLRELETSWCEGLNDSPGEIIESYVPSLKNLSLEGLNSLTNLPMVVSCLQKMPHLAQLSIVNVPKLTCCADDIGSLGCLQQLTIVPHSDSGDYISFKKTLDGIFDGSQSLRELELKGMEHWNSLPDQLQHLTNLSSLQLHDFGIEALPEWFGNLSSLNALWLWDCKNLRRLSSKQAMKCLTKLSILNVKGCALLQQRCIEQQSDDSEWPKISHIPSIYVDGCRIPSHGRKSE